jgi:hypothetical protein
VQQIYRGMGGVLKVLKPVLRELSYNLSDLSTCYER